MHKGHASYAYGIQKRSVKLGLIVLFSNLVITNSGGKNLKISMTVLVNARCVKF